MINKMIYPLFTSVMVLFFLCRSYDHFQGIQPPHQGDAPAKAAGRFFAVQNAGETVVELLFAWKFQWEKHGKIMGKSSSPW